MKLSSFLFRTSLLVLLVAGGLVLGWRLIVQRQDGLDDIEAKRRDLAQRVADQRASTTALRAELTAAEAELAARVSPQGLAADARLAQIATWVGQLKQVQRLLAEHPEQQIPQMQAFTAEDWLRLVRTANFSDEEATRKTLAGFRNESRREVMPLLSDALKSYVAAHEGMLPMTVTELAPLLEPGFPIEVLTRYRMLATGKESDFSGNVVVELGPPIDEEFDQRSSFGLAGRGMSDWVSAGLMDEMQRARWAYSRANDGKRAPEGPELLPYMESPVYRSYMEAFVAAAAKTGGRTAPKLADVLPLLSNPEARAFAEKTLK